MNNVLDKSSSKLREMGLECAVNALSVQQQLLLLQIEDAIGRSGFDCAASVLKAGGQRDGDTSWPSRAY